MRTIDGELHGPTIVRQDTRLNGVVNGDVTVPPGVRLELNGTVRGNLMTCSGSEAVINGALLGRLFHEGGEVAIFGLVLLTGRADADRCYIHPDARVGLGARH